MWLGLVHDRRVEADFLFQELLLDGEANDDTGLPNDPDYALRSLSEKSRSDSYGGSKSKSNFGAGERPVATCRILFFAGITDTLICASVVLVFASWPHCLWIRIKRQTRRRYRGSRYQRSAVDMAGNARDDICRLESSSNP